MPNAYTRNLRMPELLVLALGAFTHGVDRHLLTGLMPQVSTDLHVSASTFGPSTALFAAVFAVASPIIAALTESWERRLLLGVSMAMFLAGILLQVTASGLPALLAGSALIGLSGTMYLPTAYSSAGVRSTSAARARSLSLVLLGASLALVAGVPLAIWVGQTWGWRASLWILGGFALASTLPLPTLSPIPVPPPQQRRWQILSDRSVINLMGITVAVMTPSFLTFTYLATILHATAKIVPLAMLSLGIGGVAGAALAPPLVNWRGAPFATLAAACGVTLTLFVFLMTHGTLAGTLAPLFGIGALNAVLVIAQQHRVLAMVPETAAPFAIGLDGSAVYAGGALGAAVGGAVLAIFGTGGLVPASIFISLGAITFAAAARPEKAKPVDAHSPNISTRRISQWHRSEA